MLHEIAARAKVRGNGYQQFSSRREASLTLLRY
jgi:hypothetical protein